MRSIIFLITRFHALIIFIILEIFSLSIVIQSNNYQEIKYFNTSNSISGTIFNVTSTITNFIFASKNNKKLIEENIRLKEALKYQHKYYKIDSSLPLYSETYSFKYISARIINNSIDNNINYITLNKGKKEGIKNGYGVISSNGIVGIVTNVTENYSLVMSIISTKSRIGVRHKKTNAIGSLFWDGNNPFILNVDNFSKTLPIKKGDTIVTAGFSSIFPPELPVAIVKQTEPNPISSFYICDVKLTNSLSSLTDVYIVINESKAELDTLNNFITNE
jgi:rod shape-determining protein MreC